MLILGCQLIPLAELARICVVALKVCCLFFHQPPSVLARGNLPGKVLHEAASSISGSSFDGASNEDWICCKGERVEEMKPFIRLMDKSGKKEAS